MTHKPAISRGFSDAERDHAARLYWQAFGGKLGKVMGPEHRAVQFFASVLNPRFALAARGEDGRLLGLAGLKTPSGGLVEGTLADLAAVYGRFGALWRALVLGVLERRLQPGVLQMDGILVDAEARGRGIGTALLEAVIAEAAARGMREVQLDVIDINPRARALYERVGFCATGTQDTGPFRWVFGFASATRMSRPVASAPGRDDQSLMS